MLGYVKNRVLAGCTGISVSDQESRMSGESGLQDLGNPAGTWLVLVQAML